MLIISKGISCMSEFEWLRSKRKCSAAAAVGLDFIFVLSTDDQFCPFFSTLNLFCSLFQTTGSMN